MLSFVENSTNHTILIVDDDEYSMMSLSHILSTRHHVLTACNNDEAMHIIHTHTYRQDIHLIIYNQQLSGVESIDFLEKTIPILPEAIRILLTSDTDVGTIVNAVNKAQIYKFIIKPFDKSELLMTIERALEAYDLKLKNKNLVKDLKILNENLEAKVDEQTKQLREERDRSQIFFQMAGVIMIVIDTCHQVKLINRKGCEILGYDEKMIIGKNWFENFVHEYEQDRAEKNFDHIISEKNQIEYIEYSIVSQSGKKHLIAWYNTVLKNDKGIITGILGSGEDITRRKKTEDELRSAHAKLEKDVKRQTLELLKTNEDLILEIEGHKKTEFALQEKQLQLAHAGRLSLLGEIASGMAYELKNPLELIKSYAKSLKKWENNKEIYYKKIDAIIQAVDQASKIIKHIIGFSKNRPVDNKKVNLQIPVENSLSFLEKQFRDRGIIIQKEFESNIPFVSADCQRIEQIMISLLSNSGYAVEQRQKKEADDYEKQIIVRLFYDKSTDSAVIEIKDNGTGMTEEEKAQCLNPFFTSKKAGQGTGLGLTIVNEIIKDYNGKLEIESTKGKGTKIRVMISAEP
ncbi:Two component system response regulator/histidine kinase, PAS domain-containing [Desulfonema limicola]|uniref:histidine kinase n=1 Tax=Desulfonema limicola TaxID=45656 RepID=A0A975GHF0_9BACT|nr:PAS domain S-box protein [Desulfonema limicola]QTA81345.1 Two component system response regulator/histidine kinase, PAS domain-containing [Desulfonema limicola]